jgi:hypothetical protein
MSFGLYMVGFIVLILGIAYGAHLANVPTQWIAVAVIVMAGIGILTGVTRTRHRDPNV